MRMTCIGCQALRHGKNPLLVTTRHDPRKTHFQLLFSVTPPPHPNTILVVYGENVSSRVFHLVNSMGIKMICHRCQQMAKHYLDRQHSSDAFYLHDDTASFLSSIDRGCPVCTQISGVLMGNGVEFRDGGEPKGLATSGKINAQRRSLVLSKGSDSPSVRVWLELKLERPSTGENADDLNSSGNVTTFTLSATFNHETPEECFPRGAPDSTEAMDTGDEAVLNLLAWWVARCDESHNCGQGRDAEPAFVPPRLLKLDEDLCRLIDTSTTTAPTGPYIALSYRWGANPSHLVLATTNLTQLIEGIEYSSLPKTFQDAVAVARRLNIRYLWVDSLCILQSGDGHADDWAKHVPSMGAIYENCFLNIAAADAPDADGGCFYRRAPETLQRPVIQTQYKEETETFEFVNRDIQGRVGLFPLNERAWVYQERLLAPRTVHFSRYQIFWECRGVAAASECFPRGIPHFYLGDEPDDEAQAPPYSLEDTALDEAAEAATSQPTGNNTSTIFQSWEEIVRGYNKTTLTRPEDKLAAIAGVAKRVATKANDEYVAGIFRSQLPLGLCWATGAPLWDQSGTSRGRSFEGPYRAPSWSWASTEGELTFPRDPRFDEYRVALREESVILRFAVWLFEVRDGAVSRGKRAVVRELFRKRRGPQVADVLGVVIDPVTEGEPFGRIRFASLRLRGPLSKHKIKAATFESCWKPTLEDGPFLLDLEVDWDQEGEIGLDFVYVLILHYVETGFLQRVVQGLVLDPVGDDVHILGGAQHYRRIGSFQSSSVKADWGRLKVYANEVVLI
ncbi:heterokaryon incompatibility protein-domain-containing protein [Chaetomium fimeti]|uniref:Heterokaryon incompatibility protein-domain-containing protein n=1 Tax=Chaetomium fimeti TaxID=1854472 RepID=A0AAE0LUZ1_9PEZI|nr:heterokaryon incompatibility protein-domain-containing protein [Chaetomium fimeti]